jgi:hypothetical protein
MMSGGRDGGFSLPADGVALRGGRPAMQGFLAEKIGEGLSADIHVWAPGQVVKLFKAGVSTDRPWRNSCCLAQ